MDMNVDTTSIVSTITKQASQSLQTTSFVVVIVRGTFTGEAAQREIRSKEAGNTIVKATTTPPRAWFASSSVHHAIDKVHIVCVVELCLVAQPKVVGIGSIKRTSGVSCRSSIVSISAITRQ
jgi:hypothetical protein